MKTKHNYAGNNLHRLKQMKLNPGPTFSELLGIILGRFLILRQSLTISEKTLTTHNFTLLTNSRFNSNVT